MRYDDRIIDQVQSASDIVEIIGQYVALKRGGRNFKGLCPFHQEKTPSFTVHPEKQIFHCFGCGAGGDVFSFLMRFENMSFPEALRRLAERAHIVLPVPRDNRQESSGESEKLYELYRLATEFYHSRFLDPAAGKNAREYFQKRGFENGLALEMKIGWADDEWKGLFEFLSRKGFPESLLLKSGLIQRSAKGTLYDSFRGRLLFPIYNLQGKVVAFGGRLIDGREGPKYLNSSDHPIFHKRRELFGLHLAKKYIDREKPRMIVVEGYFGFLRLYQNGFKTAVATLGTALTEEHVRVLKRFAEEAVVVYDGDRAGEAAALRGLEVFLEGSMSVKLARLSDGLDPDDFIRQKGAEAFAQVIEGARDFFDYKLDILMGRYNRRDPAGLMKISSDFLETFSKIPNPILLDYYLKKLSAAIAIDENALRSELVKWQKKKGGFEKRTPEVLKPKSLADVQDEVILLSLALESPDLGKKLSETLKENDFQNASVRKAFRAFWGPGGEFPGGNVARAMNRIDDESLKQQMVTVFSFDWTADDKAKAFEDCLKRLKRKPVESRREELKHLIARAEREKDPVRLEEFVREYQSLLRFRA
jgi:DNA primase